MCYTLWCAVWSKAQEAPHLEVMVDVTLQDVLELPGSQCVNCLCKSSSFLQRPRAQSWALPATPHQCWFSQNAQSTFMGFSANQATELLRASQHWASTRNTHAPLLGNHTDSGEVSGGVGGSMEEEFRGREQAGRRAGPVELSSIRSRASTSVHMTW